MAAALLESSLHSLPLLARVLGEHWAVAFAANLGDALDANTSYAAVRSTPARSSSTAS